MKKTRTHKKSGRSKSTAAESPQKKSGDAAPAETAALTAAQRPEAASSRWTFLTNHSHVLILLSRNPSIVLREVAAMVGITERAVQRIIADLEEGGFLEREKIGRQNHYRILANQNLRHPIEGHRTIGDLLELIENTP
ncbi:helix-turn-helix transcriptional regulator [Lignipirellula cremea]|uniref:MarR family protein n=1 Tax=Lignipirellula cremea TaxID=2528010 RepID=A0A518DKL3_9BACT|nr:winged helix-turn-helix domain-containing protein [Lignipirellula cremea]QDU92371.1 hypothetical protein Pla8534_01170 [Lignipirellula cremea]